VKTYTYSNSGTYQFNLNHAMTRYYVDPALPNFTAVAQMSNIVVSPIQSYAMSLQVGDADLPALPDLYIDPFLQEGPLVSVGLLPVVQISPAWITFHHLLARRWCRQFLPGQLAHSHNKREVMMIRNFFVQRVTSLVMIVVTFVIAYWFPAWPPRRRLMRSGSNARFLTRFRWCFHRSSGHRWFE
jgi:hypothetical protein